MPQAGDPDRFDLLVLTASDRRQATIYRRLVGEMIDGGLLPVDRLLVVPDPGGRRVGSGGATLEALMAAARAFSTQTAGDGLPSLFEGRRVVVVHSGGESRRLPAFAGLGKVLMPIGIDGAAGGPRTMLETILASLVHPAGPEDGQLLVTAGDAFTGLRGVDLARPGVTGVSQVAPISRGSRHGVYVADRHGRVLDMLQKPTALEAREAGAMRRGDTVLVDTGILSFDPRSTGRWLRASGVVRTKGRLRTASGLLSAMRSGASGPLELYHEMLKAMPGDVDAKAFARVVGDVRGSSRRRLLSAWRRRVRGMAFRVEIDDSEPFRHPGTTSEYLDLVSEPRRPIVIGGASGVTGSGRAVVEGTELGAGGLVLGGRNLVAGLPAIRGAGLELSRGECLFAVPVRDERDRPRWLAVAHHESDDFKTPFRDRGTFAGRRIGIDVVAQTLREARFWKAGTPAATIRHALAVLRSSRPGETRTRWSLADALSRLDVERLVVHRRQRDAAHLEGHAIACFQRQPDLPAGSVAERLDPDAAGRVARSLADAAGVEARPLVSARLFAASSRLAERAGDSKSKDRMRHALSRVGDAVTEPTMPQSDRRAAIVLPDQAIWCAAPVRIDLAGGWSDTPPMCVDQGGVVVNAAVLLHGKPPIQAFANRLEEPRIVVHSVDLGASRVFTSSRDLHAPADPADWTTLPRMALRLAGVTPADPRASLRRRLERLGGGVVLTLHSAVPKGSGLGTSSILGATALACLERLFDASIDRSAIIERTSLLEQMMTTRGGWQDQVGGVHGGLKIARTRPGVIQRPEVETLQPPPGFIEALEARTVLLYTGEKRLARDILEKVVGRYLTREREAVRIIGRLKAGAEAMASAIQTGDIDAFTRRLAEYWRLKRDFDPAATNPRIDAIATGHARDLAAWELPGAGGGGFVLMLAHDESAAARIRSRADRRPANPLSRRFPLEIDHKGLRVTVL